MVKGRIQEVFSSVQGEGLYQGARQVFVRFFGCNLKCSFCDTPQHNFREYSSQELWEEMESLGKSCHSVSFTGGEPLLQTKFLKKIIEICRKESKRIYLETNGTLPHSLKEVIGRVDIVAMDFKLPSSTGEKEFWLEHEEFLRIAQEKEVFGKVVINKSTEVLDIEKLEEIIKRVNAEIPLVLQPDSEEQDDSLIMKIWGYKVYCQKHINKVLMLPRYHKLLVVR